MIRINEPAEAGARYCFVLMPFNERFDPIFLASIRPAILEAETECRRADTKAAAGQALIDRIHREIGEAAVIVAEITGANPNVLYEIGYALALGKKIILVTQDSPSKVPSSLRHLEVLVYSPTVQGLALLKQNLEGQLKALLREVTGYLRDMLEPPDSGPCYILTSPGAAREGTPPEEKTFGDYRGVIGIVRSFGIMFGERRVPELLDARGASEPIVRSNSVYIIGSWKVNQFQEMFLEGMQKERRPGWRLGHQPGDEGKKDSQVMLSGNPKGRRRQWRGKPHGLLVRGPHPFAQGKMAMILAGTRGLGTGAACLAATDSDLIRKIAARFSQMSPRYELNDKSKTFWVRVKWTSSAEARRSSPLGVTIEDVGVYE